MPYLEAVVDIASIVAVIFPKELERHRELLRGIAADRLNEQGIGYKRLITDTAFLGVHVLEHEGLQYPVNRHRIRIYYEPKEN